MNSKQGLLVTYSADADALYIYFTRDPKVAKTRNFTDDIILDFDEANRLVGIEILDFLSSPPDISEVVLKHGLNPNLARVVEHVRELVSDLPVQQVSQELVLTGTP